MSKNDKEIRSFDCGELRATTNEDGQTTIIGYTAVYNSQSERLGNFREVIAPGAFDDVLKSDCLDCRALINHDPNFVIGRTTNNTLRLSTDQNGLRAEIDLPNTSAANDLKALIERGDVNQFSFALITDDDSWSDAPKESDVPYIRTINRVSRLLDSSIVTYPAYPKASIIATRSLDKYIESKNPKSEVKEDVKLDSFKYKLKLKNK